MYVDSENMDGIDLPITSLSEIVTPKKEENYEEKLWTHSLTHQGKISAFFKVLQAVFFICVNVFVNWFSFEGNYKKKITPSLLDMLNAFFAGATIFSNLFSKTVELGNKVEGLALDKDCNRLYSFFITGPQTKFYINLEKKLSEGIYQSNKTRVIVVITSDDLKIFDDHTQDKENISLASTDESNRRPIPKTFVKIAHLAQTHYYHTYKRELSFISHNDLNNYQNDFLSESITHEKLVILANYDPKPNEIDQRIHFIRFYGTNWLERLWHDYHHASYKVALFTTAKASGALLRWNISKGFPGLVVLLTGIVALSNVEGATSVESRSLRGFIFMINFFISLLGKTLINNKLKSNDTDRELRKLMEKAVHYQPIHIDIYKALFSLLISLVSVLPYVICTAWFYTAEGLQNALNEANYIFDTNIVFSRNMKDFITYAAVTTSIPLAIVTNTLPFYGYLPKIHGYLKKSVSPQNERRSSTKILKALWFSFVLASLLDSIKFGDNASFNVQKTWEILENRHLAFQNFSDTHQFLEPLSRYVISSGVAILATIFCVVKAEPKFHDAIELSKQIFTVAGYSISSNTQNFYQFFSRRSKNHSSTLASLHEDLLESHMPPLESIASLQENYTAQNSGVS